jgi:hypothetical protein
MKRLGFILLISVLLVIALFSINGCGGGDGSGGGNGGNGGNGTVIIKGNFGGNNTGIQWIDKIWAALFPGEAVYALDLNQVAKVIIFSGNGGYKTANVTNGSFEIVADKGAPLGLIFVGSSNNNYLGYLSLKNGIDSLPLTKVANGVSTIDLQTLSSNGQIVEPSHNPIGSELPLTSEEQNVVAFGNGFFASVVKNPDVDGNGTIDLLENKFYRPYIWYWVNGGDLKGDGSSKVATAATISQYRFCFSVNDPSGNFPSSGSVKFTGPNGSGLNNTVNNESGNPIIFNNTSASYASPPIDMPNPACLRGNYTINYNTTTLTFKNIPDQTNATQYIALAVPTVTLNTTDNTINKISWAYRLNNDSGSIDPRVLIDNLIVEIDGPIGNRIYDSANLPGSTTTVGNIINKTTQQPITWTQVARIYMAYNDVFGNHIVVCWDMK